MKQELRLFFTALAYFTRIPCTPSGNHDEVELNHATKYFPLVGVVVGMLAAGVYELAYFRLPQELAVIASMVATLWLTGAFHEDGLADAIDGLGGGWTKEQVLAIMRDSRIGSYGAVALCMMLLAKFEVLLHLASMQLSIQLSMILIAGHALSRLCAVGLIHTQQYVRENGKAKPLARQLSNTEFMLAVLFGLMPLGWFMHPLPWLQVCTVLLPVVLVWLWFWRMLSRRLGGYTGDCLGAMQQFTELAFYIGVVGTFS